ncbi:membrane protein [Rothia aeria]|uniref:Membrane protein n=1 Tax=Rothia aeria TaxID=172042 RepID=A0A2Z5QWU7_9MICC|nr:membrane protein [Rothia aeria]
MVVFPVVTPELGRYRLGDVPLVHVILAASITVPWLSQAACMPIYRAIELEHKRVAKNRQELTERLETELKEGTVEKVRQLKALLKTPAYQRVSDVAAFARNWPYIYLTTLPLIILFALPLIFIMHWSASAVASYLILSVLNLAFAQLLVLPSLAKNQVDWFFAWLGYAAALLFFPIFWFLPPTAGIIVLLLCLRKNIRQLKVFSRTPIIHVAQDALRGFLTGSVLWADKYVLFVAAHGQINVVAIYISLIPCVLAYNYFFVAEADRVNLVIKKLWSTFEEKPFAQVTNTAKEATHVSNYAMVRSLTVAIFASVITGLIMLVAIPHVFPVGFAGIIAAGLFLVVTLCNYQIEFMGLYRISQLIGVAHLVLVCIIFAIMPNEGGYFPLILGRPYSPLSPTPSTAARGLRRSILSSGVARSPGSFPTRNTTCETSMNLCAAQHRRRAPQTPTTRMSMSLSSWSPPTRTLRVECRRWCTTLSRRTRI